MFGNSQRQTPGSPESEARRETILLVEDEPAVRQLFSHALSRAGYRGARSEAMARKP